jgi:hypothetical protein
VEITIEISIGKDLSSGDARRLAHRRLPERAIPYEVGTKARLKLLLPDGGAPVVCSGEVVNIPDSTEVDGLKFLDIAEADQRRIEIRGVGASSAARPSSRRPSAGQGGTVAKLDSFSPAGSRSWRARSSRRWCSRRSAGPRRGCTSSSGPTLGRPGRAGDPAHRRQEEPGDDRRRGERLFASSRCRWTWSS